MSDLQERLARAVLRAELLEAELRAERARRHELLAILASIRTATEGVTNFS